MGKSNHFLAIYFQWKSSFSKSPFRKIGTLLLIDSQGTRGFHRTCFLLFGQKTKNKKAYVAHRNFYKAMINMVSKSSIFSNAASRIFWVFSLAIFFVSWCSRIGHTFCPQFHFRPYIGPKRNICAQITYAYPDALAMNPQWKLEENRAFKEYCLFHRFNFSAILWLTPLI